MSVTKIESLEALEKVVKESSKVVVADFWATWCKPCELMNPEMETLAEDMKDDIEVVTIDVEALKDVALKYESKVFLPLFASKRQEKIALQVTKRQLL
mgnify:CR=1 FL=1